MDAVRALQETMVTLLTIWALSRKNFSSTLLPAMSLISSGHKQIWLLCLAKNKSWGNLCGRETWKWEQKYRVQLQFLVTSDFDRKWVRTPAVKHPKPQRGEKLIKIGACEVNVLFLRDIILRTQRLGSFQMRIQTRCIYGHELVYRICRKWWGGRNRKNRPFVS